MPAGSDPASPREPTPKLAGGRRPTMRSRSLLEDLKERQAVHTSSSEVHVFGHVKDGLGGAPRPRGRFGSRAASSHDDQSLSDLSPERLKGSKTMFRAVTSGSVSSRGALRHLLLHLSVDPEDHSVV